MTETKHAVVFEVRSNGRVRLHIMRDGKLSEGLEFPAREAGKIATDLLLATVVASKAAKLTPLAGQPLEGIAAVPISSVGLVPGRTPEELGVVLYVGQTRVALRLERQQARRFAEAMLAASAPQDRPQ